MTSSKLVMEAFRRGVSLPAPSTLARYGMTADDWLGLLSGQGWICPICERDAAELKLVTDHEHVAGWKHMPGKERRLYTRGILCTYDNYRRVNSTISGDVAQKVADYIKAYEKRRGPVKKKSKK